MYGFAVTRSPGRNPSTPEPTSTTSPQTSMPSTAGRSTWYAGCGWPRRIQTSRWLTDVARNLTSRSPGLGLGDLVELERLRPAVGVDANGTHELEGLAPFPGRPPRVKIAIVGGGIGGVTAALALVRKGIQVEVLEQAATIEPVGASLQLGPNAMRLLADLGLLPALRTVGVRPDAVDFVRWDDGSLLLHTELGEAAERHFGAPQLDFFRPDLHRVLVDALPEGVLRPGARV